MQTETRQHYFLIAGNVVIQTDDNIQAIPQNGMITSDSQNIGFHQLGKAQQALQLTLFKKLGETVKVLDVLLISISYLGHMTAEEFNARPEGMEVQEMAKDPGQGAEIIDLASRMFDQ